MLSPDRPDRGTRPATLYPNAPLSLRSPSSCFQQGGALAGHPPPTRLPHPFTPKPQTHPPYPSRWVYLEPIFAKGALPQQQQRFRNVDEEFRRVMGQLEVGLTAWFVSTLSVS
jgi:hypothetical protein